MYLHYDTVNVVKVVQTAASIVCCRLHAVNYSRKFNEQQAGFETPTRKEAYLVIFTAPFKVRESVEVTKISLWYQGII